MTKLQSEQCAKIAKHYGEGSQLCILQEECAELIQAISKIHRGIPNAGTHLIEELADVCIMVEQVISYIDDDEKTMLSKLINTKLERQIRRIDDENPS